MVVDTTAQPKNIAFPTDSGLYAKVIAQCERIAQATGRPLTIDRQQVRRLRMRQGARRTAQGRRRAKRATRQLQAIAWKALRAVRRWAAPKWQEVLANCARVLTQKRTDKAKIYSLHEPGVYCMAREKVRTKYEFGSKVALTMTPRGVIVAALSFARNTHDNHTVEPMLEQMKRLTQHRPAVLIGDRGFRGRCQFGDTRLVLPRSDDSHLSDWQRAQGRRRYRLRAGIEPRIGHLKSDFRLGRNFLKGRLGDALNLLLAASASNLRRWCNAVLSALFAFFSRLFSVTFLPPASHPFLRAD